MPHKTRKLLLDISPSCQEISDFIDVKASKISSKIACYNLPSKESLKSLEKHYTD
jgi:hypothetical protein